jgi:hypothetical protein
MTMSPRLGVLGLAALSIWPSVAYGQIHSSDSGRSQQASTDEEKLPWLAATLTAGPAVLGYGIAAAAAFQSGHVTSAQTVCLVGGLSLGLLGPSAGHIYTGNYLRAGLFGMGRLAFAGIAFAGLLSAMHHPDRDEAGYTDDRAGLLGLMIAGSAGVLALTIWESIDSYSSAREVNRKRKGRALALSPFIVRATSTGSSSVAGLLVSGRF